MDDSVITQHPHLPEGKCVLVALKPGQRVVLFIPLKARSSTMSIASMYAEDRVPSEILISSWSELLSRIFIFKICTRMREVKLMVQFYREVVSILASNPISTRPVQDFTGSTVIEHATNVHDKKLKGVAVSNQVHNTGVRLNSALNGVTRCQFILFAYFCGRHGSH
jgi:hypothetical protein